MSEPRIASKQPVAAKLEAGKTYAWCACGASKGQPFCDGSHQGTEFRPLILKVEEMKEAWMCQCKHTKNAPYCDGSHKTL
jgi:CDGSH-type Zn-finger protein